MTRTEYDALRNKAKEEFKRRVKVARAQLRDELKDRLKAIDTVYRMAKEPAAPKGNGQSRKSPPMKGVVVTPMTGEANIGPLAKKYGQLAEHIRNAIMHFNGDFTADEIAKLLKTIMPEAHESSISGTLARMARTNEIVSVRKGVGKTPAVYRRKEGDISKKDTAKV